MAALDRIRLLLFLKSLLCTLLIYEEDKIGQTKKEKKMLGSKNLFRSSRERKASITNKIRTFQKQPSISVLIKRCSENIEQVYRRTTMPKCDFNKVALL